jgi:putative heme-binding domain-containing protein
VFHVLPGSDAGWVSETWKHPDYYPDMPPVLASLGRGSPTGVLCYRHEQFPAEYRGALFVADWTFGRIVALPLVRDGETWKTTPKDFMTGSGSFGFAPTDMEVSPDGSMYVSVGGRGTRGGVYRVRYNGRAAGAKQPQRVERAKPPITKTEIMDFCLRAHQPGSSWSRARWLPFAKGLPPTTFDEAAIDQKRPSAERVRALEICAELAPGDCPDENVLKQLARDPSPEVRARTTWMVGRRRLWLLKAAMEDKDPLVTRAGMECLLQDTASPLHPLADSIVEHLVSSRRVLSETAMRAQGRLRFRWPYASGKLSLRQDLGLLQEQQVDDPQSIQITAGDIKQYAKSPDDCLIALRVLQLLLGDIGPAGDASAFDGYTASRSKTGEQTKDSARKDPALRMAKQRAVERLASVFPTGNVRVDVELSRTLAMLAPKNSALLDRVLAKIDGTSHPTEDVHYLLVAGRISQGERDAAQTGQLAKALLDLDDKAARLKLPIDTNWEPSISAIYDELAKRDPELPAAVVRHAKFGRAEHVVFTKNLPAELLPTAIAALDKRVNEDADFPITPDVVFLLGKSREPKHVDLVRRLYDQRLAVRGASLVVLAKRGEAGDRPKFVAGLDEADPEVLGACLTALANLPPSTEAREQIALLRALRRLSGDEREYALRDKGAALLRRTWNQDFGFVSGKPGHRPQPQAVNKWTEFLRDKFPQEFARQTGGGDGADGAAVKTMLAQADWSRGDPVRGAALFEARSCSRCHSGRTALGPDLAGATRRFSRDDIFTAIVEPSRDVSPRYQSTIIQTTDGKTYSGLVIYESVDGVTLRDGLNQTIRIDGPRIETRRKQAASLMPSGLLKDLKPADLADLYAYLQSLGK